VGRHQPGGSRADGAGQEGDAAEKQRRLEEGARKNVGDKLAGDVCPSPERGGEKGGQRC
jgi:hypothetical protein